MHWVDQMCIDLGNISINELARKTKLNPGALGNAKRRNTKLKDTSYSTMTKLSILFQCSREYLIDKYDE